MFTIFLFVLTRSPNWATRIQRFAVPGYFVAMIICALLSQRTVADAPAPAVIVSLHGTDGLSSAFLFGSGSVGSQAIYNFMVKLDDGSMAPYSMPIDGTIRLIEDPTPTQYGYWKTIKQLPDDSSVLYNWAIGQSEIVLRQEFRVPIGTVVYGFKIQ